MNKKGLITYDELIINFLELLGKYPHEEEIKEFEKENEKWIMYMKFTKC